MSKFKAIFISFLKGFQRSKDGWVCTFVGDLGGLLFLFPNHFVPMCLSRTNLDVYGNFQSSF